MATPDIPAAVEAQIATVDQPRAGPSSMSPSSIETEESSPPSSSSADRPDDTTEEQPAAELDSDAIKEKAARKAHLHGKLTAGGTNQEMLEWWREFKRLDAELRAARPPKAKRSSRKHRREKTKDGSLGSISEDGQLEIINDEASSSDGSEKPKSTAPEMKFIEGVWVEMPPPLPPLPRKTKIKINWEIIAQTERNYATRVAKAIAKAKKAAAEKAASEKNADEKDIDEENVDWGATETDTTGKAAPEDTPVSDDYKLDNTEAAAQDNKSTANYEAVTHS